MSTEKYWHKVVPNSPIEFHKLSNEELLQVQRDWIYVTQGFISDLYFDFKTKYYPRINGYPKKSAYLMRNVDKYEGQQLITEGQYLEIKRKIESISGACERINKRMLDYDTKFRYQ